METMTHGSALAFYFRLSPLELFLLLLLFLVPSALYAAQAAPDVLLRNVTSDVVASLKQDKDLADDPAKLQGLIEDKIVPAFDFSLMTQLAMGRNWRQTSVAQQSQLTAEFKAMLIRTYMSMLANYRDPAITYRPLRYVPGDTDAIVQSEVKQTGSKLLRVDYSLTRVALGWKVYDVKLDGVSVVTAYRDGFAAKIRDAGVDGLIRALAEKNRQAATTRTSLATSHGG
jgi:phospholipid transport system substrate-binding protein